MNQTTFKEIKQKRWVRMLSYPFEQIHRVLRVLQYHGSEDARYMRSLKDSHLGERCFVIGNGPSLRPEDLDMLHDAGEVCFGSNRIYQIFPQTRWRPTYYINVDIYVLEANFEDIRRGGDYPKFINYTARGMGRKLEEDIHYFCEYEWFRLDPYKQTHRQLSRDLSWHGTKTATVTVNAIELAMYMGFKTIYLLGVDNSYTHQLRSDGTIYVDPSVKSSYFSGAVQVGREGVSVQPVDYLNAAYEMCRRSAEDMSVKVYNATRGGKLEVFERVDFDRLFRGGVLI